jgi:hypothetical protein
MKIELFKQGGKWHGHYVEHNNNLVLELFKTNILPTDLNDTVSGEDAILYMRELSPEAEICVKLTTLN